VLNVWASDLRDLLPDLERVATSSPDDVEGEAATSWRSGSVRPLTDRFHAARKVAALWKEEDIYTRARLLLAFGALEPVLSSPEREARIKQSLAATAAVLTGTDKDRLYPFLERIEAAGKENPARAEQADELSRLARKAFGWPSR
jgi:hypothetical protein